MSKKRRSARKQALEGDKKIEDLAKRHTFNRGNLMLLISIVWLIGLFIIVAKYGKLW
ncbi:MAG: hypothetical protein NTV58_06995 [Deltaproteobacteria bacterium]|nr:hypothetical protein [Deltaproteobacteria bacterium]